jgi:hypothetical protein
VLRRGLHGKCPPLGATVFLDVTISQIVIGQRRDAELDVATAKGLDGRRTARVAISE